MRTRMKNSLQGLLRQVFGMENAGQPILSAAEQTRASWAKSIQSYDAVPKVYEDFFEPFLTAGRAFPYTVLAPSFEGFIHRTTEKLICVDGNEMYVLERNGNTFKAQSYPIKGIRYVEVRAILLDSHFKISGVTMDGLSASSSIKYNTVTDYLFTPFVETIRLARGGMKDEVQNSELEKFDHLLRVNYKFMNYARRSLLGGEKVIHTLLQPEIRARLLTVLGKTFSRMISPTHMIILTDRELILIREEGWQSGDDHYGGIWDYVSLEKIISLSLKEKDNGMLILSIQLADHEQLECLFQASVKPGLDQLIERFGELTGK